MQHGCNRRVGNHPVDQSAPSERDGSGDRMALDHAPGRLERLRTRAQRTRADLEARRAGSASIDSAFEAVERDAQTGGGVLAAAVAFRLFMYLVPYAFVVVTGFGLASTGAGQDPEDAAALGRHRWPSGECGGKHKQLVAGEPYLGAGARRHRVGFHGPLARRRAVDRAPIDLGGPTLAEANTMGPPHPGWMHYRALRLRRFGGLDGVAVDTTAVSCLCSDHRRDRVQHGSWHRCGCPMTSANGLRSSLGPSWSVWASGFFIC